MHTSSGYPGELCASSSTLITGRRRNPPLAALRALRALRSLIVDIRSTKLGWLRFVDSAPPLFSSCRVPIDLRLGYRGTLVLHVRYAKQEAGVASDIANINSEVELCPAKNSTRQRSTGSS